MDDRKVININNTKIGDGSFAIIAGPCAIQSEEQMLNICKDINNSGATILHGGIFKSRTSPYDFQSLKTEEISLLLKAKKETGLPIIAEITTADQIPLFKNIDIIQVGPVNMQNYELLKALAKTEKPILLKRGMANTYKELLLSAEYIISEGNENVILCECGIRTFETYTKNTLDVGAVPALREMTDLPVIIEPGYGTGKRSMIAPMSAAAAAVGADGIILEVSDNAEQALSNGYQSISISQFNKIVKTVLAVKNATETDIAKENATDYEFKDDPLEDETQNFILKEHHIFDESNEENILALGDNLQFMRWLLKNGYEGKIKLIYIDPPFFTKARYDATLTVKEDSGKTSIRHAAYDDVHEGNIELYLDFMRQRLALMHRLLADDGLIWVHLDWHSVHHVKIVMDEIFGDDNFINEIIWKYKSGGSSKKHFSRKHDNILVYSKTKKYYLKVPKEKSYNRGLKPYRFKGVEEFVDEYGWYTMVNMKDVWTIDMVGRTSSERTGYATQKPEELMKRIIISSTKKGDLCADFFCGSGSLLKAANDLGRSFIGCDGGRLATSITKKRLDDSQASFNYYIGEGSDAWTENGVTIKCNLAEELENGKSIYSFEIENFTPQIDTYQIEQKDVEALRKLCERAPKKLIDHVLIDTDYSGIFSCEMTIKNDSENALDNIRLISRGNIAFIIVDIFGKEYFIERKYI